MTWLWESPGPEATTEFGAALAPWLREGDVLLLHGDLGAGKTTLAKGIAAALGVAGVVSSPSFGLVNEYETGLLQRARRLYHLDLFRLEDEDELASIGLADLLAPTDGVTIVEWPERAAAHLPDRYLLIELEFAEPDRRRIRLTPVPAADWEPRITDLLARLSAVAQA